MTLNIKDPETDRLARQLAQRTGESITEAVRTALEQRMMRELARSPVSLKDELMRISRRAAALPRRSDRSSDEIIGYDDRGLPI